MPEKLSIGICGYFLDGVDAGIRSAIQQALEVLENLGHRLEDVQIPGIREAVEVSRIIAASEAAAYHEELIQKHRNGYDPAVLARLETGFEIPAYEYVRAFQTRDRLRSAYREVFRSVDCLAGAAVPVLPHRIDSEPQSLADRFAIVGSLVHLNAPQNVAGVPALVFPCGFSKKLPVSLQLIAPWHREDLLFRLGKEYQLETDWHLRTPPEF